MIEEEVAGGGTCDECPSGEEEVKVALPLLLFQLFIRAFLRVMNPFLYLYLRLLVKLVIAECYSLQDKSCDLRILVRFHIPKQLVGLLQVQNRVVGVVEIDF